MRKVAKNETCATTGFGVTMLVESLHELKEMQPELAVRSHRRSINGIVAYQICLKGDMLDQKFSARL